MTGDLPGAKPSAFVWKRSVIADRSIEGGDDGGHRAEAWHDGGYDTTVDIHSEHFDARAEAAGRMEEVSRDWTGLDFGLEVFGWVG